MGDFKNYKFYKGETENPWKEYYDSLAHYGDPGWFYRVFWILEEVHATKGRKEFEDWRHRVFGRWIGAEEINGIYYFVGKCIFKYDDYHYFSDVNYINLDESLNTGKLVFDDSKRTQSPLLEWESNKPIGSDDMLDIKYMRPETVPNTVKDIYKVKQIQAISG